MWCNIEWCTDAPSTPLCFLRLALGALNTISQQEVSTARTRFPGVPFTALTATATADMRAAICTTLKLQRPVVACHPCLFPRALLRT